MVEKKTIQELIEQAKIKEARAEEVRLAVPAYRRRVAPSVRKADVKVGRVVRKDVSLIAPKDSMVRRITSPAKKKDSGRGRGRPKKSYKLRYVPGVGTVRVPTHIYNKMMAEVKAKKRLAEAQRQATSQQQYEAEQMAMAQDPRYQPSAEDAWVDSEDLEHEAEVRRIKQQQLIRQQVYQQQQIQRPTMAKRAGEMFSKARISLMGTVPPQQYQPEYARQFQQPPQIQPYPAPQLDMERHRPVNPQVVVTSGKSPMFGGKGNIMDQKNEFNETNRAIIGFGR